MTSYVYDNVYDRGTIRTVDYLTTDSDGAVCEKCARVYLPYGYDPKNSYNILYLIHGGGGSEDAWLDSCPVKNMLDYAIERKECDPLIVVFPSFYKRNIRRTGVVEGFENDCTLLFQKELTEDLIPAVESRFRTYAAYATDASFKSSRLHRAISGFSMGGVTTWYCFMQNLPYFSRFAPLSGDCWAVEPLGGGKKAEETAALLAKVPASFGMGAEDFGIFAATGTKDIAHPQLSAMVEAMKQYPGIFTYSEDPEKGNFHYLEVPGLRHEYPAVCGYLYHILPHLFA